MFYLIHDGVRCNYNSTLKFAAALEYYGVRVTEKGVY